MIAARRLSEPREAPAAEPRGGRLAMYSFFGVQIACTVLLAFTPLESARFVLRASTFAISLVLLVVSLRAPSPSHPVLTFARIVLALAVLAFAHPYTNAWLSGAGHVGVYFAILGPLFWGLRLPVTLPTFQRAIFVFWVFHTLSATAGVVQVYAPGTIEPNVSSIITASAYGTESLKMTNARGEVILRPAGLTDAPGGAAWSGFYATVLGAAFLVTARTRRTRLGASLAIIVGMTTIYLSQVRSVVVSVAIVLATFLVLLVGARRAAASAAVVAVAALASVIGLGLAFALAPDAVSERLETLLEGTPGQVYYANRGLFIEGAIEHASAYPFGSGLGRWGMINAYLGDRSVPVEREPLWVETQWNGWVIDGGVPFVAANVALLLVVFGVCVAISRDARRAAHDDLRAWAALGAAYTVGVIAVTFNYPIFISQTGMEFFAIIAGIVAVATARGTAATPTGQEAPGGDVPDGRRRLRAYRRDGHGEPRARRLPRSPGP